MASKNQSMSSLWESTKKKSTNSNASQGKQTGTNYTAVTYTPSQKSTAYKSGNVYKTGSGSGSGAYRMSADTYNKYEADYANWKKTGQHLSDYSVWSNENDLNAWKGIKNGKYQSAQVGDNIYYLDNDSYKRYGKDYQVWSTTGNHSSNYDTWGNNDGATAYKYIQDDKNGYGGLNNLKVSLDDELVKAVAEKYKSQWGDKYYYDVSNYDDIVAMNSGQMPAYLRKKYKTKDPIDQYLLEQGLPYSSLFNDMYSEAWQDRNERNAKKQSILDSVVSGLDAYDKARSGLAKDLVAGKSFTDALGSGKYDVLGDYYDKDLGKTKTTDTEPQAYFSSKQTELDPIYERAYKALYSGKAPDDEFYDHYKESTWKSYLKKKNAWNESSFQDALDYQAQQKAGEFLKSDDRHTTNFNPETLYPVTKEDMQKAGYRGTDDYTAFNPIVYTDKKSQESIILNPVRSDGTIVPKEELDKYAKDYFGEAGILGGLFDDRGNDPDNLVVASFETKREANAYAKELKDSVKTYYGTDREDFGERLEKALEEQKKSGPSEKIDLENRPIISSDRMQKAGWDVPDGYIATVDTSGYSNKDESVTVLLTPITQDGNTILRPEELQSYADKILSGGEDDLGLVVRTFTGKDSKERSNEYAQKLHEAQEEYYTPERIAQNESIQQYSEAQILKNQIDELDEQISHIQDGYMGKRGASPSQRKELAELNAQRQEIYNEYRTLVDTATGIANTTKQNAVIDAEIASDKVTQSYASRPDFFAGSANEDATVVSAKAPIRSRSHHKFANVEEQLPGVTGSDESMERVDEIMNNYANGVFFKIMQDETVSDFAGSHVNVNDPEQYQTNNFNEYFSSRYMTDEEMRTFQYIAKQEGADAAVKYMDDLLPVLNWRNTEELNVKAATIAGETPVLAWIVAGLSQFPSAIEGLAGFWSDFGKVSGDDSVRETMMNDPRFNITRKYSMVDKALTQMVNESTGSGAVNYAYNLATNVRDNVIRQAAALVLEALAPGVGTVFSTASVTGSVLADSLMEQMDDGVDIQKATMLAFLNAGAESLGEAISLNQLFGFKEGAMKYVEDMAKKGVTVSTGQVIRNYIGSTILKEGGSEFLTSLMSFAAEFLTLGDESETMQVYNEAEANGKRPLWEVIKHIGGQALSEGVAGALTGFILGGPSSINNVMNIGASTGAETDLFNAGMEAIKLNSLEQVELIKAYESKIESAVAESGGTTLAANVRLQIQQDIKDSTILTEEQKNVLSNAFELIGASPSSTLEYDDLVKMNDCVEALHQSTLDQNAKDAKTEQKASKSDERIRKYFDSVLQYQYEAQLALNQATPDLQAHAEAMNHLRNAVEQYKYALTEYNQQQNVDETQQAADQEKANTKLEKQMRPVNEIAQKVLAWYQMLAAQTEVEVGAIQEQAKAQVLAEQETTQFLFDEMTRLNAEYNEAQTNGDITKVEEVTKELDNYRQMFGDDVISAVVQNVVGGNNGTENASGPNGVRAGTREAGTAENDVSGYERGRNDVSAAEPLYQGRPGERAADNQSENTGVNRKSPAASWDEVDSEKIFKSVAKDTNRKKGLIGGYALKASDFETLSAPVNDRSATALANAIERTGGRPVHLFRCSNPDAPGGFVKNGEIFINDTGTGIVAFTYGHEYAHLQKALHKAGKEVFNVLGDNGKKIYQNYCETWNENPNDAGTFEEFICDIHGAYEYNIQTGIDLSNKLGFTGEYADLITAFYDAFSEIESEGIELQTDSIPEAIHNVASGGRTDYNYHTMSEDEALYRQDLIDAGIAGDNGEPMTMDELDSLFNTIDRLMDIIGKNRKVLDFFGDKDRSERAFSPYKDNSDPHYKMALDFSTLCRKRVLLQSITERLQSVLERSVSPEETVAIREEIKKYQKEGFKVEVACALCYVEAPRMKSSKVINEFLDNRDYYISHFMALKNPDFKSIIADRQAQWKVDRGYRADATKSEMSKQDVDDLNRTLKEWRDQYVPTEEERAIIDKAEAMDRERFLSAKSLTRMKQEDPVIYDAFITRVRSAMRSKAQETDVPYARGDIENVSDTLINKMNEESGFRHQSWSDFEVFHLLDDIASIIELSTRHAKMHAYTKVPNMVITNGRTGLMMNMSLIPAGKTGLVGDNRELAKSMINQYGEAVRAYREAKENGASQDQLDALKKQISDIAGAPAPLTELILMDPVEGMPKDAMVPLRDHYHKTAGNIMIGINDDQIRALLASELIDYVIPYHISGLSADMRRRMGIKKWDDYTRFQNEKSIWGDTKTAPKLREWFNEEEALKAEDGVAYMQEASKKYLELCAQRGLVPKFWQFLQDNGDGSYSLRDDAINYWKLLIDRKMVDQTDNKIIKQEAVVPRFDERTEDGTLVLEKMLNDELLNPSHKDDEYVANSIINDFAAGKIVADKETKRLTKELQERNIRQAIEDWAEDVSEEDGIKLSSHNMFDPEAIAQMDEEYMAAVERGDKKTTQRMVNERAAALRAEVFAETDVPAFSVRRGPAPKKTRKVYKVFTIDENGKPTPLFNSDTPLPVGVWLDAKESDAKMQNTRTGAWYIPVKENKNSEGGNPGRKYPLSEFSDEDKERLVELGHLRKDENGEYSRTTVQALRYRPGWHASSLPYLPEDGIEIPGSNYRTAHRYNQAVFECEIGQDTDYTDYHISNKGSVIYHDMQELPANGSYRFSKYAVKDLDEDRLWYLSGSLKIGRALTEAEVNDILEKSGMQPQEWQAFQDRNFYSTLVGDEEKKAYTNRFGPLNLEALGYDPNQTDGGRKLLDAVTYDDDGNVIPLSQRFNPKIKDPRFSFHEMTGENPMRVTEIRSDAVDTARQAQELYQRGVSVDEYTARSGYDMDVARQLAAIYKKNTPAPTGLKKEQRSQMYDWDSARLTALKTEDRERMVKQREAFLAREGRTKYRKQITETAADLRQWLEAPNTKEGKYVPDLLRDAIGESIRYLDLGSENRPGSKSAREWRRAMQNLANNLAQYKLRQESENIDSDTEGMYLDLPKGFVEGVQALANSINEDSPHYMQDMSSDQLKELAHDLRILRAAVRKTNKQINKNRSKATAEIGNQTIGELDRRKTKKESDIGIIRDLDNALNIGTLDPTSYGKRLGAAGSEIINGIVDGFIDGTAKVRETDEFVKNLEREEGITSRDTHKWSNTAVTIKTLDGDITMTEGQLMNLYALSNRPQALQHILQGGIELGYNKQSRNNQNKAYKMNYDLLDQAFDKLSDKQKKFVNRLQEYLSTTASQWGNEVTQQLWDIDLYGEPTYWPIRSAKSNLATQDPEKVRAMNAIINSSFTNLLNKQASNPIMLDDAIQVFTDHVAQMSNYNGMAIPISNAMKWFNYQYRDENGKVDYNKTVKRSITNALGKGGLSYFINLIKDVNGLSEGGTGTELPNRIVANAKKAAVAAKLRVMIQQPTAIVRAMSMINPAYFVGLSNAQLPKVVREMQKYAPIAWWKSQGNFEIGTGKSMRDILFNDGETYDKIANAAMAPAGIADDFGWAVIWNAVKREQKHRNPGLSGDELMEQVNKRFTQVINNTQVIDTIVHRPQVMRSKDTLVKQMTAFMSEPMKTLNMLNNAIYDWKVGAPGAKLRLFKTASAVAGSWALNAAVLALHDSLRDRDEDEDFWEHYKQEWIDEFKDNAFIWNSIPYVKDVANIISGEDVDRMDMNSISELVTSVQRLMKAYQEGKSDYTIYGLTRGLVVSAGNLLGTPINGLLSSAETLVNAVNPGTIVKKKTKGWEKADSLVAEGIDRDRARGLMKGFKSDNTATKAFSILTYDGDRDGVPDFDEEEQNIIAEALGLSYDPEKYGSLTDYAVNAAENYLAGKQKIMDDEDASDDEYEKASKAYDEYSAIFDDYFSMLGLS